MPRQARILSDTGIYYIMIRRINKEQTFKIKMNKINKTSLIKQKEPSHKTRKDAKILKEYKYLKEWTKKKKKYVNYCVVIFIIVAVIMALLCFLKNSIPDAVIKAVMLVVMLLFLVLVYLFIKIRTCPKCGYYFGRHGYASENCPRCGIRLEE